MSQRALRPRRRPAGHARKPRTPLRRRIGRRLPGRGRLLALLAFAAVLGGTVTLVNGPWLRVVEVAHAGERYTPAADLNEILGAFRGAPLLAVDSGALAERIEDLPAVASARVEAYLPGTLRVSVVEKAAAFTWVTRAARLVGAADGSIIAELPLDAELPAELAALPAVDDQRPGSRGLGVGDTLSAAELRMALRLLAVDPALLGSAATALGLQVDPEYGFVLVSAQPPWRAALGFYQLDPAEDAVTADARLDAQIAAVRTLFAGHAEASVSWVDARNPGRVYWAP